MLLTLDIGNTHIVVGVYRQASLVAHWRLTTTTERTADEYRALLGNLLGETDISPAEMSGAIIASVVPPLLPTFEELCAQAFGLTPLVVRPGLKTGLRIWTDNPREVGADRVVNAVAARALYGTPAIVIDFSTATTFDAISAAGDYLGNAIAPGLVLSAQALFRQAAQLPHVALDCPPTPIGTNTVLSMQSGLVYGHVAMVKGMIERFWQTLGDDTHVIATGEYADMIAPHCDSIQFTAPNLTLEGLRLVYEMNHPPPK